LSTQSDFKILEITSKQGYITHGSNNENQSDTRKGSEFSGEHDSNVKTILEEADIDGCLEDLVFIKT
jgi:hypothetical protein